MRAAFMLGRERGRGPRGRGAQARSRGCPAPRRGLRHLRDRRPDVLQRRPPGARRRGSSATSRSASWTEVGPDAVLPPGVAQGDRVFLGSILTCGECRWCLEGFQNLCEHHLLYGYDPFPGAYAEWAAVPADRHEEPDPAPRRPAERPGDGRRSVRLRPERHRDARRPDSATPCVDPGRRADRLLAGADGPRPRRRAGCSSSRRHPGRLDLATSSGRARSRRRLGRRGGQRRRRGARADRRVRRRAGQRGRAVEAGAAGRPGDGGQAGPRRLLRRACRSTTRSARST